jgi:hypothetical protein
MFYVVGLKWVFSFDITAWGWILLAGALLFVAGSSSDPITPGWAPNSRNSSGL